LIAQGLTCLAGILSAGILIRNRGNPKEYLTRKEIFGIFRFWRRSYLPVSFGLAQLEYAY